MLASVALAVVAMTWWFGWRGGDAPAAQGVVTIAAPGKAARQAPAKPMPAAVRQAQVPAMPAKVIADVRAAYPLLTQVDFSCDAGGCAVTATIPPPPPADQDFLDKRQALLTGGLAKTIAAEGYRALGPVHMDEVGDNLFHIRLPVAEAR
ncbi:hypothetical protein [Sphingomonas sp. KR3-1]|uniref:hypothetical protein n=1 Tax=Sphingomonas sp. KR3-1 TaxID=3156611 RepID=UPI0032B57CA0